MYSKLLLFELKKKKKKTSSLSKHLIFWFSKFLMFSIIQKLLAKDSKLSKIKKRVKI